MQQSNNPNWHATATSAMEAAKEGKWTTCQELCALTAVRQPPAVVAVSHLNILICQYHLGFVDQVPERVLSLIANLPLGAVIASLGLSLLAARKSGTLLKYKGVAVLLAEDRHLAMDLPTVPTFVLLLENQVDCMVLEHKDASLMSEVVAFFLCSDSISSEEAAKLGSLASRYCERVSIVDSNSSRAEAPVAKKKAWWRRW